MEVPSPEKDPIKRKLLFSPGWPDELESIMKESTEIHWQVLTNSGQTFRLGHGTNDLPSIPQPADFPLTIEPVSEVTLMTEELERLSLEESLLEEQLFLAQLEEQEKEMLAMQQAEEKHLLNSTTSASSNLAPSEMFSILVALFWKDLGGNSCANYIKLYELQTIMRSHGGPKHDHRANRVACSRPAFPLPKVQTLWRLCHLKRPWSWKTLTSKIRTGRCGIWVFAIFGH